MDPITIIKRYYRVNTKSYRVLIKHSVLVAEKAFQVARRVPELRPDLQFIEEAAMLHDIGIFLVHAPKLGCYGEKEYICHGFLGRELLDKERLPRHALVCERHTGVGLTLAEIKRRKLPLPLRDMVPLSVEEQIICFADKFFSKSPDKLESEKTVHDVKKTLSKHGQSSVDRFNEWCFHFREI